MNPTPPHPTHYLLPLPILGKQYKTIQNIGVYVYMSDHCG